MICCLLNRTETGELFHTFSYGYTGNQLTTLSDGAADYAYAYDLNGNMTNDGLNGFGVSYNHLNLIEKVLRGNTIVAKYSYLSDGTKLSAFNSEDDGLEYHGSLVYKKQGGGISLESAGFTGGRFISTTNGLETYFHLTDHLGSVRVVVGADGEVAERNDYYPFGLRWNDAEQRVTDNRYRYNGKEDQSFAGIPYSDYGARMYDPCLVVWHGVDKSLEKYYSISPYTFCVNNPINAVDWDGRDVIVLRNSAGAKGYGHAAVLIGNDNNGWTYISKDGYSGKALFKSKSKFVAETFSSLEDFKNSPHNFVLKSGTHSTTDGTSADDFDFELDENGNKIQRYDQALQIETTQADGSSTDEDAKNAAEASAKSDYALGRSDCSDVVTAAIDKTKDKNGNKAKNGEGSFKPNKKFNNIEKRNPDAKRIDDKLKP